MLIRIKEFIKFLKELSVDTANGFDIYLPVQNNSGEDENLSFKKLSEDTENIVLDTYRALDPPKLFLYPPVEQLTPSVPIYQDKRRIICGMKNCDLSALEVLDSALINEDFVDPNYQRWRELTYIISADCNQILPTCHCLMVDKKPYPETGFDLNISRISQGPTPGEDDQFLVTMGSDKGKELMQLIEQRLSPTMESKEIEEKVAENHKKMIEKVLEINKKFSFDRKYEPIDEDKVKEIWADCSSNCIECGGCTNICPTCYCILLNDETKSDEFRKIRTWDSCQYYGYARVAGGATPRPHLWERFRHRYQTKFLRIPDTFGKMGCTGCGRCISVCPGEIDLREVVEKLQ